jgi:hypothetical protein
LHATAFFAYNKGNKIQYGKAMKESSKLPLTIKGEDATTESILMEDVIEFILELSLGRCLCN